MKPRAHIAPCPRFLYEEGTLFSGKGQGWVCLCEGADKDMCRFVMLNPQGPHSSGLSGGEVWRARSSQALWHCDAKYLLPADVRRAALCSAPPLWVGRDSWPAAPQTAKPSPEIQDRLVSLLSPHTTQHTHPSESPTGGMSERPRTKALDLLWDARAKA